MQFLLIEKCVKQDRGICKRGCTFDNLSIKYNGKNDVIVYSKSNSKCNRGYESNISKFCEMNQEAYDFLKSKNLNIPSLPVPQD